MYSSVIGGDSSIGTASVLHKGHLVVLERSELMKRWLLSTLLVAVIIAIVWVLSEKPNSYSEPQEALFEIDNDLLLIPAYKLNDKALFFFIKNEENLGTVYV